MSPDLFLFIAALLVGFIFATPARIPVVRYHLSHHQIKRWFVIVSLSAISFCASYISLAALFAYLQVEFACPTNGSDVFASFCGADSTQDYRILRQEFFWRGLFLNLPESCFSDNSRVCNAINEYNHQLPERTSDSITSLIMGFLLLFTSPVTCGINVWFITLDDGKRKRKEAL